MNTNAEIEAYAKQLLKKNGGNKTYYDTLLMKKDGINFDLKFHINDKIRGYELRDPHIYTDDYFCSNYVYHHCGHSIEEYITLEKLTNFLKSMFEELEDLVFDKSIGKFIDKKKKEYNKIQYEAFKKFLRGFDDCSVCLEQTTNKTPCGHTLCMECWQKLENPEKPKCPICRGYIDYVEKCCINGDSDSDEE